MGFSDENEEGSICIALVVIGTQSNIFMFPISASSITNQNQDKTWNPKPIPALMQIANDDATSE